MSLTAEQAAAASARGGVAVTAGAGTGKTYMLAERYLYHLQVQGFSPLEIVAVTFTDKAASELRSRIRDLVNQKLPERHDLLAELEAAQISTIHALATRICREHPEAANVNSDFQVLDELEGSIWLREKLEEALDGLPASLYEQIPYSLMSEALATLIKDPIAAERALSQGTEDWQQLAADLQKQAVNELLNDPVWQQSKDILQSYMGKAGDRLELEVRQVAVNAIAALEQGEDSKITLTAISELKLNVGSKKNWAEGALEIVKDAVKQLRDLVKNALKVGLVTLEISPADRQLAAMLPTLKEGFQLTQKYLNEAKIQARVLDFADLEVHALQVLQDELVQSYYQERWQAFLVDEFQDTNPVQGELLELLTKETMLTIVGDVKQSIYGFRRADVTVFQSWRDRIVGTGGSEVILNISFRTHKQLVEQIDRIFALELGKLHQNLAASRVDAPHPAPHLRVYTVQADSEINKPLLQRVEANHIAQLLKQMLDEQTLIHDKKTNNLRAICPGDIAVLSRTWEALEFYNEALVNLGIPTAPAGGGNLLKTREAKDAWALLRFLAEPADDLALVALLRSPFFAVSDRILFNLANSNEESEISQSESKISWWQKLKETEIAELSRPQEILNQLLRERTIEAPTRLLQLADRLTGYTAVIANLPGTARRDADWRGFLELVRQLEQGSSDVFTVVRRLRRIEKGEVEVPRLSLSGENAIALMTIHAAKGLEWPVVVLPDLARSSPNSSEAVYFDPKWGVALKLEDEEGETKKPVLYVWLEYLRKQQEEAEALRVLYVALTRARDHLILTATNPTGGSLDKLQSGFAAAGIVPEVIPFDPECAKPPLPPEPALLAEPSQLLIGSVGSGLFELPITALSEYARCPKRFQFRYIEGHPGIGEGIAVAQRIGTLVHIALERGIGNVERLAAFDIGLAREWVEEAFALAQRFVQVPQFAHFREVEAQREQPVRLSIGQLTFNGVVDLLGSDWVLDFKTDREMLPQDHRFQLWAYAQATKRTTAHIAYLRHDRIYSFSESELKTTAQEAQILVRRILAGDYSAIPSHANCGGCVYGEICQEKYQGLADEQVSESAMSGLVSNLTLVAGDRSLESNPKILSQSPQMLEILASQLTRQIELAAELYYRLIIVIPDRTQTDNLPEITELTGINYINVNLELSRRLLELTQRQRSIKAQRLLEEIIGNTKEGVVFLDGIEILFDVSLKLDPLKCLQGLSRNRTVVAVWRGSFENNYLTYAEPNHPEYHCYLKADFLLIDLRKSEDNFSG